MFKEEDIDKIAEEIEKIWMDRIPERQVTYGTGRSGAINAEVMLIKSFSPEREEDEIRKEVEAKIWEDGMYQIGGDPFIKYLGLWDSEHADGFFGVRVHGLNYVEHWKDGCRIQYKIVSDEEFESLKDNK